MAEYYECAYCGQVVQGFEAAHSLPQQCPKAPDHKWVRVPGLDTVLVEGEDGEPEEAPLSIFAK